MVEDLYGRGGWERSALKQDDANIHIEFDKC